MPSTSPGDVPTAPSSFVQILPGAPTTSLQSLTSFVFRQKRYIAYVSGGQLNLLISPKTIIQALTFDDDLVAIAAETETGNVTVASKRKVWVLEPHTEGWTKVWWQKALLLIREDAGDVAQWLSWGNVGELLVGGSRQLSLFNTLPASRIATPATGGGRALLEQRKPLWSVSVASSIQYACFSPSGGIIASFGKYDRLVKIWRRLSFEEGLFDYTYLPHPGMVTHLEWRPFDHDLEEHLGHGVSGRHDEEPEVLFTLANDGILRVWVTGGLHDLDIMILHTIVDLNGAIPESPSLPIKSKSAVETASHSARYTFIVPSYQFCMAVSALIPFQTEKLSHSLEHLKEMAFKEPDVIITLDGRGRMSAWGLQTIGHMRRPETPSGYSKHAFHISHAERLPLRLPDGVNSRFESWFEDGKFNVLAHSFSGYMHWWRGSVADFFSPSATGSDHLEEAAYWSGHRSGPITTLAGSSHGRWFSSCNMSQDVVLWKPSEGGIVHNEAMYTSETKILDMIMIPGEDDYLIALEQKNADPCDLQVSIRGGSGKYLDTKRYELDLGDDNTIWNLYATRSEAPNDGLEIRCVALNNNGRGFTFPVDLKHPDKPSMGIVTPISLTTPDDCGAPIHSSAVLDAADPNRVGFISATKPGSLLLHHIDLSVKGPLEPLLVATIETGVPNPSSLATRNEFAAIVSSDRASLAIVNLRDGYVEHRRSMGGEIRHIVPDPKHNSIAVGYESFVNILTQGRYEHFGEMPPWIPIKQISIASIGLEINAMAWLGDGSFALAAGNSIFLSSNDVPVQDLHRDVQEAIDADPKSDDAPRLSTLARQLKTPLPVWHPSLVAHTVRHGHWNLALNILSRLAQKLKFWSEGEELHPHLEMSAEQLYEPHNLGETPVLDERLTNDLMQLLDEKDLPEVSMTEQERLKRVLLAMAYCSAYVSGLDNAGIRFLFSWKLQLLLLEAEQSPNGTAPNRVPQIEDAAVPEMHWREIAFAYHSTTQQPLLELLMAHYDNKITWTIAKRLGLFAWLSDREALDRIFDALAQSSYRSTDPPDPINATMYFLALHKKPTLLALWRIATWHKEQKATMNFLRRDFTQPQNQTAAKKNAYALMGKKRFDYAAAFFLLADDAASATSLLASQCDDIMLAIAVARLYSGDGSPVLRKLLEDRLMPQAREKGDRWLMSWCHAILFEKDSAAEALVQPLGGVRNWHQDDPNTLTLYQHLRNNPSEYEYEAILRAARILRRMGLWLLALELVSQWKFKPPKPLTLDTGLQEPLVNGVHSTTKPADVDSSTTTVQENEPPSMLDGFVSPPATPAQDDKAAREAKAAELLKKLRAKKKEIPVINEKKPEPTQLKEPDANSLLDNFGF
jgi:WD40 repeat protein